LNDTILYIYEYCFEIAETKTTQTGDNDEMKRQRRAGSGEICGITISAIESS